MSDTVSFAELDGQHVELLPARTVLSMFSAQDGGSILDDLKVTEMLASVFGQNSDSTSADGAAGKGSN